MHFDQSAYFWTWPIVGTIVDHIYTNHSHHIVNVGFHDIGLADCLPIFVVRKYSSKQAIAKKRIMYRNMKHFNAHDFLSTLNDVPWDPFLFFFYDISSVVDAWEYL